MNSIVNPDAHSAITHEDLKYLHRTLALARRGLGRTAPNPMVGAVVVKEGQVIGEGFHPRAGLPHAEVFALRAAGEQARGSTLYVSLEPCAHHGKTPPCADAVVQAGIRRVVFASLDPNPRVAGRGLSTLRDAGIVVGYGALTDKEQALNEAWRHWMQTGKPFVTLKLAASLDGKIATRTHESQWITGEAARRDVHRLRATQDAILTTAATVVADNPALTARIPGGRAPRRVILDADLRTSPDAQVYAPASPPPILVTAVTDEDRLAPFRARNIDMLNMSAPAGHIDLGELMTALGEREILSLMTEAGGGLAWALLDAGVVRKVRYYLAPLLIGGEQAVSAIGGAGVAPLADAFRLERVTCKRIGDDYRIEGYLPET